ncbi:MAG TPA: tetratricopeptide repeat protein [Pirellulales bacterium]|jgi:tetratricopeptide (TPR) repeat protein
MKPAKKTARKRSSAPVGRQESHGRTAIWGGVALVALVLTSYAPVWRAGFIWDDDVYVTENATLDSLDGLRRIWFELGAVPQYYPLVHTTFWIERHIWGLNPTGFHAINILLHAVNAVLVWRLLLRLRVPGAWLGAALFAVHPVEVESVAWITERKNVLSLALALSSIFCYWRYAPAEGESTASDKERTLFYLASLLLFVAALFSKTVVVSMPAVLLVLIWWKRGQIVWGDVLPLLPFLAVGVSLGLITVWAESHVVGAVGDEWALTSVQRLLLAGRDLWFYAGKLAWPVPLTFFYPRWTIDGREWWQSLFPLAAVTAIAALWLARLLWGRGPLAAILIFAGILVPALGFFDVYPFRYSFVADHFQYHASIALLALAAAGGTSLLARRPDRWQGADHFAAGVVLFALGVLTFCQTFIYYDLETLYADTLEKNPSSWAACTNLSLHYLAVGRRGEAYDMAHLALQIAPNESVPHGNLAALLLSEAIRDEHASEKLVEAIRSFERAIELNPRNFQAKKGLGYALLKAQRYAEAEAQLRPVLEIMPDDANALYAMGVIREDAGQFAEARAYFEHSLRGKEGDADTQRALGNTLLRLGRLDEAETHLARALALDPHSAATRVDLGNLYLSRENFDQAARAFREAIDLRPTLVPAHRGLGMVLLAQGKVDEAIRCFQESLRQQPDDTEAKVFLDRAKRAQRPGGAE